MKTNQLTTILTLSDPQGAHGAELCADYFDLQPTPEQSDGGTLFAIDHTFHIDEPPADVAAYYAHPRNAIVTLHTTDGASHALGSRHCPVRAHVYRLLQGYALHVAGSVERVFG